VAFVPEPSPSREPKNCGRNRRLRGILKRRRLFRPGEMPLMIDPYVLYLERPKKMAFTAWP
jgi:hypothetical protein